MVGSPPRLNGISRLPLLGLTVFAPEEAQAALGGRERYQRNGPPKGYRKPFPGRGPFYSDLVSSDVSLHGPGRL